MKNQEMYKLKRIHERRMYMTLTYYKAKQIILADSILEDAYLKVVDGRFQGWQTDQPTDGDIVDYGGATISAGFVDTHIHGYNQADVMDNDPAGLDKISQGILKGGVTSWLATTLTSSTEDLNAVCQTVGQHYEEVTGARIQGIFLEGPYFTEKYKGAQNPAYMSDPSIDQLKIWQDLSGGLVKKIAIAPERQGVAEFTEAAKDLGVYVALAHSDATYDQAKKAVDHGANIFIHTFNGMSGLHHREPGMVGAALTLPEVYAELIADGHHVHPVACGIVSKLRGPDETVLITDCMRAGGIGEGLSRLGEFEVMVKDGQARLIEGGNLAGSVLELIDGVKHMVQWGHVSLAEGLRMASYVPAKSVGIEDRCGQIKEGYLADFIVVNDHVDLLATYLGGDLVYQAD